MYQDPFFIRVIDLKQYVYCPRILYFHTVLPDIRPLTYKMEAGIAAHQQAERREKRRLLRTYGLQSGERAFNVPLLDADLGLSGEIDMVITTPNLCIPVDYKASQKVGPHFKLQLMAYGRLLEMNMQQPSLPITHGFLYMIPLRKAVKVAFTSHLRRKLDQALTTIKTIVTQQAMPAPTNQNGRCVNCEFRRFCNDTL